MLKKPGEGHSIKEEKGQLEKKKKKSGGTGWGNCGFLFWALLVELKAAVQPHGPGPCRAPAGRERSWETLGSRLLPQPARPGSGAALPTGAPSSFSHPGHSSRRGWFVALAASIPRRVPALHPSSIHLSTPTLCPKTHHHPRCPLNKFQVIYFFLVGRKSHVSRRRAHVLSALFLSLIPHNKRCYSLPAEADGEIESNSPISRGKKRNKERTRWISADSVLRASSAFAPKTTSQMGTPR